VGPILGNRGRYLGTGLPNAKAHGTWHKALGELDIGKTAKESKQSTANDAN